MVKKIPKTLATKEIQEFFSDIKNKTPEEVKKIKRLAMSHNIKLGDKRKLFCKKCLTPHKHPSIRIKNDMITISCDSCKYKNRWKFKGNLNLGVKKEVEECC